MYMLYLRYQTLFIDAASYEHSNSDDAKIENIIPLKSSQLKPIQIQ